jgi:hypothetical protein
MLQKCCSLEQRICGLNHPGLQRRQYTSTVWQIPASLCGNAYQKLDETATASLAVFQQVFQLGEGLMGGIGLSGTVRCHSEIRVLACYQRGILLVLPVVAVQAEVLPVTAVGWVVVVIVVLMMDR